MTSLPPTPPLGTTPASLAEPTAPAARSWVAWITLASIGLWAGFFGPIQVLLAQQAAAISPDHKELVFGLVTGIGAAVSVVCNPLFGAFSDRTVSKVGRRFPWVLGGAAVGAFALVLLAYADTVLVMALAWSLAQAGLNAMLAAITATVPDQVPVLQRGAVGGWLAVAQTLGIVGGVGIAAVTGSIAAGYLVTAAALVVLALPYLFDHRDIALDRADREPWVTRQFLASFWIDPRRFPDFGWAWLTRFLVNLGNALGTLYLFFYLQDAVGYGNPEDGVFILTVIYAVLLVVTTVLGGIWSDRLARRKVFVVVSGVVTALAALTLALVQTWPGAIAGAVILGAGYGIYTAVDFALITEVLPEASARAKDLGVINVANALPQVIAPLVATVLVQTAGGYVTLYLFATLVCLLGSWLVRYIRSVP
ncbi:MAG TPA: MFS transporter [Nocardioidaceae bacterium]|nr:MFS transporter [Nocardioidaceae bacterium]